MFGLPTNFRFGSRIGFPSGGTPVTPVSLKIDIGRVASGEVAGWDDEVTTGVSVSGGTTYTHGSGTVDTTGETDPAPEAVYRNVRYELGASPISAMFSGLTPSATYNFRTHHWTHSGEITDLPTFSCDANGVEKFNQQFNFAGNGVYIMEFSADADGSGEVLLEFTKVITGAILNGIEITN